MNNKYIGGNFASTDIEPYYLDIQETQLNKLFPENLNSLTRCFYETGADALSAILIELNNVNVTLWFPDNYCSETIKRVLLKTKIQKAKKYLSSDAIDFENGILNIVVLVHFNAYRKDIATEIKNIKNKKEVIVIEDYVHAPLEINLFTGDFAFNSLRKISNLEVAITYKKRNRITTTHFSSSYYQLKKEGEALKSEFMISGNKELEEQFLQTFSEAEKHLMNDGIWLVNEKERSKIFSVDLVKIREKRRRNFIYLKQILVSEKNIEIVYGDYLFLMIRCRSRDELRRYLFQNSISAPIHWFDSNSEISKDILSLPIDQRYDLADMNRLSETIIKFYK